MQTRFSASVWMTIRMDTTMEEPEWVAHCLDFDVVTQGRTVPHAIEMLCEALGMIILDDLSRGADPHDRRAPAEDWAELDRLVATAQKVARVEDVPAGGVLLLSMRVEFEVLPFAPEPLARPGNARPRRPWTPVVALSA